jgi:centrosomal protein CEP97
VSRLSGQHHRPVTADAVMSSSFHGVTSSPSHNNDPHNHSSHLLDMTKSLIENFTSDALMTQSLDPTIFGSSSLNTSMNSSMTSSMIIRDHPSSPTHHNGNLYNEQSHIPVLNSSSSGPLVTASKMMPVPESLMSPDCGPSSVVPTTNQQLPIVRPVSSLTTSTTSVRTTKVIQQRPSSSPAAASTTKSSSRIAMKKVEKLSPSNSPRKATKAMMNTANTRIHQSQSILKNSTQNQTQAVPPPPTPPPQTLQQQQEELSHQACSSVTTTEDEDEDECDKVNVEKLKSIKKVAQKNQKQLENHHQLINKAAMENKEAEKSAILIQKLWRGYSTRKQTTNEIANALQQKRTNDYILKLAQDMEMTKQALENERKIQQLQMQAINALWKKVSSMQTGENGVVTTENGANISSGDSTTVVHDLTKTCSVLTNQVINFVICLVLKLNAFF